jgi:hypothetical protein
MISTRVFLGRESKSSEPVRHKVNRGMVRRAKRTKTMKYMMLIHHDEALQGQQNWQQLASDYAAFNEALTKAGGSPGQRLKPADSATSVRSRDGKTDVLDGPYADTKEQFAGYFMIDADTLDDAIAWALRCPSSRFGTIEIRPIVDTQG